MEKNLIDSTMQRMHILFVLSTLALQANYALCEKCLSGPYHRNQSGKGGKDFAECLNYKENACCTGELTKTIKYHPEKLYNFTWHHCKAVSKECMRYLADEECFYQCDPTLIRYQRQGRPDAVQAVPICSDYCEKWFEACKSDMTCVENWETGFVKVGGQYSCPNSSKCRSFTEVYKNGEGLCNKMWGVSFSYSQGGENCYQMDGQVGAGRILQPEINKLMLVLFGTWVLVSLFLGDML